MARHSGLGVGSTQKTTANSERDNPGQFVLVLISEDQIYVAERELGKWGEVMKIFIE